MKHLKQQKTQQKFYASRYLHHEIRRANFRSEVLLMNQVFGMILISAITVIGVSVAQAQVSIRDLQRNSGVQISGIIRSVVGNEFILDDGTGQIIVDAGPRWYHQLSFTPGERVTVVGEYDDEDFDAYRIIRDNGEVLQIREAGGPPPWAGNRGRRNR